MRGLVAIVFVVGGCDLVFELEPFVAPVDAPIDGPTLFCAPPGDPALDSDGDGILDHVDNCPAARNADQHDEDGDCRGDACDNCPWVVTDPDAGDTDSDSIGNACDPSGDTQMLYFDTFDVSVPEWTSWGCPWDFVDDAYAQGSGGLVECFATLGLRFIGAATLTTSIVIPPETIASNQPFSVGLAYRLDNCSTECFGQTLSITRDTNGSVYLSSAVRDATMGVIVGPQLNLPGPLDDQPIGIEVSFEVDGSGSATVTYHGIKSQPLVIPAPIMPSTTRLVGFFTRNTTASFGHFAMIE